MSDHSHRRPREPQIGSHRFGPGRGGVYEAEVVPFGVESASLPTARGGESGSGGMIDLFNQVSGYPGAAHPL